MNASSAISKTALDHLRSVLYFPVWWYSAGLKVFAAYLGEKFKNANARLGFTIWLKNIFRPMFGETEWTGRLVSFFMRLVNIIIRGIAMVFVGAFVAAALLIWLGLPVVSLWLIFS